MTELKFDDSAKPAEPKPKETLPATTEPTEAQLALIDPADLSLVENNSLNAFQLKQLLQKTPKQYVHTRPAKGGGVWAYVTGGYVKKVLNIMFGWNWSFDILGETIYDTEVVVKGKLTCTTNGVTISKMQYGNKDIAFLTETKRGADGKLLMNEYGKPEKFKTTNHLSIGNDLKAAATDCLKKCASEIGIAADIYNAMDFKEVAIDTTPAPEEDDLQALYDLKEENLSEEEKIYCERILKNAETKSYKRLRKFLMEK